MRVAALFALAIAIEALAIYVLLAAPHRPVNRWFAAFTMPLAGWIFGIAALTVGWWPELWGRLTFASASLVPAAFLGFTTTYPRRSRWPPPRVINMGLALGALFTGLSLGTALVVADVSVSSEGLRRTTGVLYPAFAAYFLAGWLGGLGVFIVKWRGARGVERVQLQFFGAGLVIATIGGLTANLLLPLLTGASSYAIVGPYSLLPLVLLLGHAIIRHRLLDLRLVIGRGVSFAALVAVASTAILGAIELLDAHVGTTLASIPRALIIILVVAVCSSAPVAPRLARAIDRYLLRERRDLDHALRNAASQLVRLFEPLAAAQALRDILIEVLAPEFVTIVTRPIRSPLAGQPTAWDITGHVLSDDVVRIAWQGAAGQPKVRVIADQLAHSSHLLANEASLEANGIAVLVDLGRAGHSLGAIFLGAPRSGPAYLAPSIGFLEELALIASRVLETAYLHHQQIMLERDRERLSHIARLGRSFAIVAHEIRSPLTTISNFVAGMSERFDDPEYRDLIVRLVPAEVARIVSLTNQLEALRPEEQAPTTPIDVELLLKEIGSLLAPSAEARGHSLEIQVAALLPRIQGRPDRLHQLFQNLVRNAMEAMPRSGRILLHAHAEKDSVIVRIFDEGDGLSIELQDSPFEAFISTKESGLGLGLSICQEVAVEHQAQLSLTNRPDGRGAVAEVVFPASKS
jgi:signal transduction histidine kinase